MHRCSVVCNATVLGKALTKLKFVLLPGWAVFLMLRKVYQKGDWLHFRFLKMVPVPFLAYGTPPMLFGAVQLEE
jgi:hypothetical protein